eukprot:TRINITY_DN3721_c0_g1_i2.p1 TRINITY_DN3721_c0_g1~~TRINITY_DN3721_c0_g1_i2.p1  ORF type:complete len:112 (-),score=23.97 TRINITY_DN3721_c0_g1_i2:97-432(-)
MGSNVIGRNIPYLGSSSYYSVPAPSQVIVSIAVQRPAVNTMASFYFQQGRAYSIYAVGFSSTQKTENGLQLQSTENSYLFFTTPTPSSGQTISYLSTLALVVLSVVFLLLV